MADRQFRFRLPWLSAVTAARPPAETQPPRPTAETQAFSQPTTTIPLRPPFRPTGIAPAPPPPPQVQAPQTTEPQPTSPPRVATESQVAVQPQTQAASVPSSPSHETTQTRAASVPPSPFRPTTESQVAVQPQRQATSVPSSPSRAITQTHAPSVPPSPSSGTAQPRATSVPPSPSRAAIESQVTSQPASPALATTQIQPASQTRSPFQVVPQSKVASVPPSPSRTMSQSQPAEQTIPQLPFPTRPPFLRVSQPTSPSGTTTQVQPTDSQLPSPSKKIQPNIQETSQPPPTATEQEQTKPAVSLPLSHATQLKMNIASEIASKLQDQAEPIKASDSDKKAKEAEEGKKVVEELQKEEKTTGLGTQAKDLLSSAFNAEQGLQKEDGFERKKTTITSSNKEPIKAAKAKFISSESHQKPIMSNGEKVPLHKEIREDISKLVHKLGSGHHSQFTGEKPVSIVTLAGENRGATMHLGSEPVRKDGSVQIHQGYEINPDDSSQTTIDGEGSLRGRKSEDPLTKENPATKAYINSNTQCVNNSIVFESSVKETDPGVQLILSHNQTEPTKSSTKPGPLETHKAEFNITPAEKLIYEPTV